MFPYREEPTNYSPHKPSNTSFSSDNESTSEPLDFSTKRNRPSTPETRNAWMASPESGVSSLGGETPPRLSPERDSPVSNTHSSFPFFGQPSQDIPQDKRNGELINQMMSTATSALTMGNQGSLIEPPAGTTSQVNPHLPAIIAHLQQTNPLMLSTLCNLASQRVSEITQTNSARPMVPLVQAPPVGSVPLMGLNPASTLAPVCSPTFSLDYEAEETARSNEAYLKFRSEMLSKGHLGSRGRRPHPRHNPNREQACSSKDSNSGSDDSNTDRGMEGVCRGSREIGKNEAYWERRRKNNEAAKRSRDARRAKEDEVAIRAAFLETENLQLKMEIAELKRRLRYLIAIRNEMNGFPPNSLPSPL